MINQKTLTNFINEFEELIANEKRQNKPIEATVTKIENNIITTSLKKPTNIQKNTPVEISKVQATIIKNNHKRLKISVEKKSQFNINQNIKITNIQKEIIIQKLENLLNSIKDNKINQENIETLKTMLENYDSSYNDTSITIKSLNENQLKSLNHAISTNKFHIIKGPPGTGKTHTIIEIINYLYKKDYKILITTHTHIALDNILEKLDDVPDNKILRVGIKEKISKSTYKYTIDEQIKQDKLYEKIKLLQYKNNILKQNLKRSPTNNNDASDEKVDTPIKSHSLLQRIISKFYQPSNIKNNYKNIEYNRNTNKIMEQISYNNDLTYEITNEITTHVYQQASIIATTILSSSATNMKNIEFDYMIMDEASQVPVYLSLIALMKTNKFILIGDDKQLQPITTNYHGYLTNSIFNHMIKKYPNNYTFLNIQYRMNHNISDIASKLYYNNKLQTYPKIADKKITLKHNNNILLDDNPLTLLDTSNTRYHESNTISGCCNKNEAQLIISIIKSLIDNDINTEEIGIITPYKKQKLYIQKQLKQEKFNIECDTIYRFQGREKDVIIISFCKSSYQNLTKFQKKFLSNQNQLNVSITRSRKKLIIIGDVQQLNTAKNMNRLFNEIPPLNTIYLEDLI